MVWLITGASGQLGLAMSEKLESQSIPFKAVNSKELDVSQEVLVDDFLKKYLPSVVVNCAAWTDVDGAEDNEDQVFRVNSLGPKYLASSSRKIGAKLVQVSTDYVFSGESDSPFQENAEMNPVSVYGRSKCEGEKHVQAIYPEGTYIVRTAWLYSPNGKNFAKTMINLALANEAEVRVVNDQFGQPTSAGDLADQVIKLVLNESRFGIYHGTNSGETSWFHFAQEIFRILGRDLTRVKSVNSSEFSRAAKRPTYSVLGHEGWNKVGLSEMRGWLPALENEIPRILASIEMETR
jgi:dTDP-4-dehydrorhamnose reductase